MKFGKDYENIPLDTLEKMRMHIDILKIINDMEMDRERFYSELEERKAQLKAEDEERKVRIEKMQAEQAKIIKETKLYPWVAFAIAIIALCATVFK